MVVTAFLLLTLAVLAVQQSSVQRTVLQQGDLSVSGREGVLAKAEFAAGVSTGRHTHPGDEISYVLEGTILLEVEGQAPRTLRAGDTLMVPAGRAHNATNSGTAKATVIAVYFVEKGKPLASPAAQ
jgi:quercetin dioxygenase-like cupin family protein